jgi:hypothetical protein
MYSTGIILYAAKDGVAYYSIAGDINTLVEKSKDQFSDPIRNLDETIGTTTGNTKDIGGATWIEVDWINNYKKHGLFGIGRGTENEPKRSWVKAVEVTDKTSSQIKDQAAKDAAAAKAKQQQALIDVVGGGNNANLTANGGTTTSNNSIYWIVGGVLVFIAGIVIWKVASKPKAVTAVPTSYVPTAPAIPKPTKLR